MTRKAFKNHLFYNWFYYVIIIFVVCILDFVIVRNIVALKGSEKLSIFICADSVEKEKMEDIIKKDADPSLKEINIYHYSPNDSNIGTIIQSVGTVYTDLIIVPKSLVSDEYVYRNCYKLYEYKAALDKIDDFTYVKFADYDMGIEAYNNDTSNSLFDGLITYYNPSTKVEFNQYVLLFNQWSPNLKSITGSGETDNATDALKKLLAYEN